MQESILQRGKLPNLRDLIIPDTTKALINGVWCRRAFLDMDLARADIQVVAWDANCARLKALLIEERTNPEKDLHTSNALELFGHSDKKHRDLSKKIAHASNYLVTPRTCAQQTGILVKEAERFIARWFYLNPEIPKWHERYARQLAETRTIRNAFGYRRFFYGRTEDSLPEAVAWVPQSTVGLVINHALCNIDETLGSLPFDHPHRVDNSLQVHDSLTMQFWEPYLSEVIPLVRSASEITIPYPDPLVIPVGFKVSSVSWGQVKEIK